MLFGEKRKNKMLKSIKYVYFALLLSVSITTVACQTKEVRTAAAVKKCQVYLDRDEVSEAGDCYQQAVLANPSAAKEITEAGENAIFQKCVDFKNKEDFRSAIICFEGITELMPNSANVQFNLADSYYEYFKENGYKDAEILASSQEAVEKGLQVKNDDIAGKFLYAEILQSFGKLKEAKEQYKKLIELDSKTSLYWSGLGLTQQKLNEDIDAIKSFEKAIILDPKNYLNYAFSAKSHQKIGEIAKAIEALEKALQLEPSDVDVKAELNKLKEELKTNSTKRTKSKASGA